MKLFEQVYDKINKNYNTKNIKTAYNKCIFNSTVFELFQEDFKNLSKQERYLFMKDIQKLSFDDELKNDSLKFIISLFKVEMNILNTEKLCSKCSCEKKF